MTMSAPAIASANASQTAEVWLVLLTITHPSLPGGVPIRVVNNTADITSGGNLYQGVPFDIALPGEDPAQPGVAKVSLDGVDGTVINALRGIQGPAGARIDVILASSPNTLELTLDATTLRNVASPQPGLVTGDLNFEQIAVEPVATNMTPSQFPGLY